MCVQKFFLSSIEHIAPDFDNSHFQRVDPSFVSLTINRK